MTDPQPPANAKPIIINETVYVPIGDNPDGLADYFPLLDFRDLERD
ncbi:hypothetical protein N1027_10680 [Herbiconiux sp. CPCC 205763]|uniref:Uncharacterized protein n=1 Tax=Herbiconiux aconitum TaxID=2970913 RepID=A0ABT2GQY5_9MICO|nr:hypothetical protein [Herbiconiux aconitum]MCS5718598.1 hypothetical protein [Herbiconiux aconitum]